MVDDKDRDSVPRITFDEHDKVTRRVDSTELARGMRSFMLIESSSPGDVTARVLAAGSGEIPQAVDSDVSDKMASGEITARSVQLTLADKVMLLTELCEMACRQGVGQIVQYPTVELSGQAGNDNGRIVKFRVLDVPRFVEWLNEQARWEFSEFRFAIRHMKQRGTGVPLLEKLHQVVRDMTTMVPDLLMQPTLTLHI